MQVNPNCFPLIKFLNVFSGSISFGNTQNLNSAAQLVECSRSNAHRRVVKWLDDIAGYAQGQ